MCCQGASVLGYQFNRLLYVQVMYRACKTLDYTGISIEAQNMILFYFFFWLNLNRLKQRSRELFSCVSYLCQVCLNKAISPTSFLLFQPAEMKYPAGISAAGESCYRFTYISTA